MSHALFDAIKAEFTLYSDAAICKMLDVNRALLSRMRTGLARVTGDTIITIHEETGWPVWRIKELIASKEVIAVPQRPFVVRKAPKAKQSVTPPPKPTSFIHRVR